MEVLMLCRNVTVIIVSCNISAQNIVTEKAWTFSISGYDITLALWKTTIFTRNIHAASLKIIRLNVSF